MSVPLRPDAPAYWMLEQGRADPSKRSKTTVHQDGCYICEDEEFSLMGLPLCWPCTKCGGHVAADGSVCDACGFDHAPDHLGDPSDSVEVSTSAASAERSDAPSIPNSSPLRAGGKEGAVTSDTKSKKAATPRSDRLNRTHEDSCPWSPLYQECTCEGGPRG